MSVLTAAGGTLEAAVMVTLLVAAGAKAIDAKASIAGGPDWLPLTPVQVAVSVAALEVSVVLVDVAVGPLAGCAAAGAFFMLAAAWSSLNAHDSDFACACFGRLSAEHGPGYVLGRNLVLVVAAILGAAASERSSVTAWTVFAGVCLALSLLLEELGCEGQLAAGRRHPVDQ